MGRNLEDSVVKGFGQEWARFDQSQLSEKEAEGLFRRYFAIFPWSELPKDARGFDMGCGSGRWAKLVAPKVGMLHLVDASGEALTVAQRNLASAPNCQFHLASVDQLPFADQSMDFAYSLGVLHHIPDTLSGIKSCVRKLKPGAPFLIYLYYRFDNRPLWFRLIWMASEVLRRVFSRLPFRWRSFACDLMALTVYWPLARFSKILEVLGLSVSAIPLSAYRDLSFYSMRTDALDRFGTKLEQRFTAPEIEKMLREAGCDRIHFSQSEPFWVAVGHRRQ